MTNAINPPSLPTTKPAVDWSAKFKAAALHLCVCITVALTVFLLMSQVWYPDGLLSLAGGLKFFTVLVCCDVILGPIITLIVYSTRKSKRERFTDFATIAVVQAVALGIGLQAIVEGRPAFSVFTGNRIEVINAVHMLPQALSEGKEPQFQTVSWQGPVAAIAQYPKGKVEAEKLINEYMTQGYGFAYMPRFYQPVAQPQLKFMQEAIKPIADLRQLAPNRQADIAKAIEKTGLSEDQVGWLDVETSSHFGVAIVERQNGHIHFYLDIDA